MHWQPMPAVVIRTAAWRSLGYGRHSTVREQQTLQGLSMAGDPCRRRDSPAIEPRTMAVSMARTRAAGLRASRSSSSRKRIYVREGEVPLGSSAPAGEPAGGGGMAEGAGGAIPAGSIPESPPVTSGNGATGPAAVPEPGSLALQAAALGLLALVRRGKASRPSSRGVASCNRSRGGRAGRQACPGGHAKPPPSSASARLRQERA